MSETFSVDPEILHHGATRLDEVAGTTTKAAHVAQEAVGSPDAFGASGEARELAAAWAALVKARATEMESLAAQASQLAQTVREAAEAYKQEDTAHSETMKQQEKELAEEHERQRDNNSQAGPGSRRSDEEQHAEDEQRQEKSDSRTAPGTPGN
ncbi:type VII secretion target [Saccharomonospora cyanea]|uniref:Excreted virulence factor EspC, type VII ESX diderm n=1 Tax=Saccharomonospora cyanea NA-134 TaxID=882082 RepID=H5XCJ0_9PSEU|nr:type VII secretion target [Saccharomonospora cyanea]EHR60205.1 Protein of unknown function (DUF2580) [Saccharomonospora cyanea NA-134]